MMFDFDDDGKIGFDDIAEYDRRYGDLDDMDDMMLEQEMQGYSSGCLFSLMILPALYVLKRLGL